MDWSQTAKYIYGEPSPEQETISCPCGVDLFKSELNNIRYWPDLERDCAECPECKSTLLLEVRK